MYTMNSRSTLEYMSPKEALQKLIDDNVRFRNHQYTKRDSIQELQEVVEK